MTKTSIIVILPSGQKATLTATARREKLGIAPNGIARAYGWTVTFEGRETGTHSILVEDCDQPLLDERVQAHWAGYQAGCQTRDERGVLIDWREQWATERAEGHADVVKDCRRNGLPVVQTRGREWVIAKGGVQACEPLCGAKLTHKSLAEAIARAQEIGAEEIELREGFNGAESVRDMIDDLYEPWVGEVQLTVWVAAK